jgi:hypothetical protein
MQLPILLTTYGNRKIRVAQNTADFRRILIKMPIVKTRAFQW